MSHPSRVKAGICLGLIPEKRIRRGAATCTPLCKKLYKRVRDLLRDEKRCRTCGRGLPKSKQAAKQIQQGSKTASQSRSTPISGVHSTEGLPAIHEEPALPPIPAVPSGSEIRSSEINFVGAVKIETVPLIKRKATGR